MYSSGGIELSAQHNKVKVVNTLDSRLDMMTEQVGDSGRLQ